MSLQRCSFALLVAGFIAPHAAAAAPPDDRLVAASTPLPKARASFPPREQMDDPPAPPDVIASQAASPAALVPFGRFTSIQVNVDAFGNNRLNDAANEPSMAINPLNPNQIVIGWRQFDTILSNFRQAGWAYSTDGGTSWTFPDVLTPGVFRSDPVLSFDATGAFYYSSLLETFEVEVFKSTDGGMSWSPPSYAFGGDKQWMTVDDRSSGPGAGHIYQMWTPAFSCCDLADFTRSIDGGLTFQAPLDLPDPRMMWGTLDTDSDGVLYLAGSTVDPGGHLFTRSFDARNPAATPTFEPLRPVDLDGATGGFGGFFGPNPAGLLGQVWIAVHPGKPGHVYILSSVIRMGDPSDVMFTRSADGGQTWSPPVRVNDDEPLTNAYQWFGTLSVAPNGRLDAIWNDTRATPSDARLSAVFHAYSLDEGQTWSANEQVSPVFNSHLGFPQQNKIGDYSHSISDNGGANFAYAATFNGEQDVYFLRIGMDCNENGRDDDCDTACGAAGTRCDVAGCGQSPDCNGNHVPDECEPDEDCDESGVRDLCEIGKAPHLDCNANSRLDVCEDSRDCNGDQVLDLCEFYMFGDCNGNGVPDECDVSSGVSMDRNGNGVPDECQGACCNCLGCATLSEAECRVAPGVFGGSGTICSDGACERPIFSHDDCDAAEELPSAPQYTTAFSNLCASTDGPPFVVCSGNHPFGADLWYNYTAPCTGTLRLSTCSATDFDAFMAVYDFGSACACPSTGSSQIACGDDTCGVGGGPPEIDLSVIAGRCYTIRLGGYGDAIGSGELELIYETACNPTDLTGDGITNLADFARFQNCVGPVAGPECAAADFNRDGVVDLADYRAMQVMIGG